MSKGLGSVISEMQKKFGSQGVVSMADEALWSRVTGGITTGSIELDIAVGRIGLPRGRVSEITGLESSGKSTAATELIAQVHRHPNGIAVLADPEQAYLADRVEAIGGDPKRVLVLQQPTIEDYFNAHEVALRKLVARGFHPIVSICDSVAGFQSGADEEGDYDDVSMGAHARVLSRSLRKLVPLLAQEHICMVFINQLKEKIGGWTPRGQKVYSSLGGHAIPYHASVRVQIFAKGVEYQGQKKKEDEDPTGTWGRATIVKNKVAPPHRECRVLIRYDKGYDKLIDLARASRRVGVLKEAGSWLRVGDTKFRTDDWPDIVKRFSYTKLRKAAYVGAQRRGLIRSWSAA